MREKRISASIKEKDVKNISSLLREISKNKAAFRAFSKNPYNEFKKAGLDLVDYCGDVKASQRIAKQFASLVELLVTNKFARKDRFGLYDVVMAESMNQERETGVNKNWDHSTETTPRHENMTETTPGTSAEKNSNSSTWRDEKFDHQGISMKLNMDKFFAGPMISEEAFDIILRNITGTLSELQNALPIR